MPAPGAVDRVSSDTNAAGEVRLVGVEVIEHLGRDAVEDAHVRAAAGAAPVTISAWPSVFRSAEATKTPPAKLGS